MKRFLFPCILLSNLLLNFNSYPQCNPLICDDGDACTTEICSLDPDPPYYRCSYSTIICDDGDPCSIDGCNPTVGCTLQPSITSVATYASYASCSGGCIGLAGVSGITGGMPPYTYTWSNGDNSIDIRNLCVGFYSVTVTDLMGCIATGGVNVAANPCDDQDTCTFDFCDNDACYYQRLYCPCFDNTPCDDGSSCTVEQCDSSNMCQYSFSAAFSRSLTICAGDSIFAGGNWQDASGTFYDTLLASGGCDSLVTTALTVLPITECIACPYCPPSGKDTSIIGPELTQLCLHPDSIGNTLNNPIYRFRLGGYVMIDVIANNLSNYDSLRAMLIAYGMIDLVDNGDTTLVITGFFPVSKLCLLNSLSTLINHARPVYAPILNSGIAYSRGDTSIRSAHVRQVFDVSGSGIKVCALSDSYNNLGDAEIDVANGELPGSNNPFGHPDTVEVMGDYPSSFPYYPLTDEGRALLQIIHDVAPWATLGFRTGVVSPGDFAEGIDTLQKAGCKVIVDDITWPLEPFFHDGMAARKVNEVKSLGVSYFSAAGNFGNKSYEAVFNPIPGPAWLASGTVHNFGGGDFLQKISLKENTEIMIAFQWDEPSASDWISSPGAASTDLDLYLADNAGNRLAGSNRVNTSGDPFEILYFSVNKSAVDITNVNIMVARTGTGTSNVRFKYIVLRGVDGIEILEPSGYQGSSTIVGQTNAAGCMAVGAVNYIKTQPYGSPLETEFFSSVGKTGGNKPDFAAPDSVNTSVSSLRSFRGTSASVPHAAGVAALVMEAKKKFCIAPNDTISPDGLRSILKSTALNVDAPGFDSTSGAGLIQADAAIQTFATPKPFIDNMDTTGFPVITINGNYFSPLTQVFLGNTPLASALTSQFVITATVPGPNPPPGNPPLYAYNPPGIAGCSGGGFSDSLYFTPKQKVVVIANNDTIKYGEQLPVFTAAVTVDGVPAIDLAALGLANLQFYSSVSVSDTTPGQYIILPLQPSGLDKNAYDYVFRHGILTIERMPLRIAPRDTAIVYGSLLNSIAFNYNYNASNIAVSRQVTFFNGLTAVHESGLIRDTLALVHDAFNLTDTELQGLAVMMSLRNVVRKPITTTPVNDFVDISVQSIRNYRANPDNVRLETVLIGTGNALKKLTKTPVNGFSLAAGTARVNGYGLTNGSALVNSNTIVRTANGVNDSNEDVAVIIDSVDVYDPVSSGIQTKSINMITGIDTGAWKIVPGAMLSENFEISYDIGNLLITPANLIAAANNITRSVCEQNPPLTITYSGFRYEDNPDSIIQPTLTTTATNTSPPGTYPIIVSGGSAENYAIIRQNGMLTITGSGVNGFTLVREGRGGDIGPLNNYDVIRTDCRVNIRADIACSNGTRSMEFRLNGTTTRIENYYPYALAGDHQGNYYRLNLSPGLYRLEAIPWSGVNATGTRGASQQIWFTVSSARCNNNNNNNNNNCRAEVTGFTLVREGRNGDIGTLNNNVTINTSCGINVRAEVACSSSIRSVQFLLNGNVFRIESLTPYALAGDHGGNYYRLNLSPGQYHMKAIPWSGINATGSQGISYEINFTVGAGSCNSNNNNNNNNNTCRGEVAGFTLVRTGLNGDVGAMYNGAVIGTGCNINIRANVTCSRPVRSVSFDLNGSTYNIENAAPYALAGDRAGSYYQLNLTPGNYHLKATPWTGSNATGASGTSYEILFTISTNSRTCLSNRSAQKMEEPGYGIKIYPNPNQGEFFVYLKPDSAATSAVKIAMYDLVGKKLFEKETEYQSEYLEKINIREHSHGTYLLLVSVNGITRTEKILYLGY